MPRNVVKRGEARRDLLDHFVYIGRHNVAASRRFLRAVDKALEQLAELPEMGALWSPGNPALADVRYWSIRKFENHVIFYRPLADGIEVLRVLHGAQDIDRLLGQEEA